MSRVTPPMRNFAKRLIGSEDAVRQRSANGASVDFPVPERLRPHLATLMGNGGVRALLSRSLSLAAREVPWLAAVHTVHQPVRYGAGKKLNEVLEEIILQVTTASPGIVVVDSFYTRLTTGLPERVGQREERAPEPKATANI